MKRRRVAGGVLFLAACLLAALALPPLAAAEEAFQPWVKRGVILEPGFAGPRSSVLLTAPSIVKLRNGRLRMYFWGRGYPDGQAGREEDSLNYIFAAEALPSNPFHWELVKSEPMLGPGTSGNIRDRGPSFPWVVPRDDGPWLMYYCAWGSWASANNLSNRTGLAISRDEGMTWEVLRETVLPLGQPGSIDAGLTGSVDVMRTGAESYTMWYTAGEGYKEVGDIYRGIIVDIGMAHSTNGVDWVKYPKPALMARREAVPEFEAIVSKPSVLKIDGVYHMWFSVDVRSNGRRLGYRLGYARSADGLNWNRYFDKEIMPLTPGGFDSANQSYPYVIDMGEQLWMFYTGDRFGVTGIGLATLDKDKLRP